MLKHLLVLAFIANDLFLCPLSQGLETTKRTDYSASVANLSAPEAVMSETELPVLMQVMLPDSLNYQASDFPSLFPPDLVRLVKLRSDDKGLPYEYDLMQPGIEIAMKKAFQMYNVNYTVLARSCGECSDDAFGNALNSLLELIKTFWFKGNLMVLLGPSCPIDLEATATMMSHYAIGPIIAASSPFRASLNMSSAFRLTFSASTFWIPLLDLCKEFNWTNVNVIYFQDNRTSGSSSHHLWYDMATGLFNSNPYATNISFFPIRHDANSNISRNLQSAFTRARIHIIVGDPDMVRGYLLTAADLGMTNGEHMFFAADLYRDTIINPRSNTGWRRGDDRDDKARAAYRSLLIISLRDRSADPPYLMFVEELKQWGRQNQFSRPDLLEAPNYYMLSHHDAVLLPAVAAAAYRANPENNIPFGTLQSSVSLMRDPGEGTFRSTVFINAMQQVAWNWTASGLRMSERIMLTKTREICDSFDLYGTPNTSDGTYLLVRAYNESNKLEVNYTSLDLCPTTPTIMRPIMWPNKANKAPINMPECGYLNEKCPEESHFPFEIVAFGLGTPLLSITLIVITVAVWKAVKYSRSAWNWIVHPNEIHTEWPSGSVAIETGLEQTICMEHTLDARTAGTKASKVFSEPLMPEIASTVGIWKKRLVAVRHCYKKYIAKHFRILQEVQWAIKIDHENVLKFLGASIHVKHVAVLYQEVGTRGRLIDLINSKPKMDWEVRFSFATDLIHGLLHLYSKWLQCHGRLSTFCLWVDEKFVIKISDYGLPSFLELNMVELWFAKKCPGFYVSLLWTSPEILRDYDSNQRNPNLMTKAVDVYSYGIILQELITWSRPFSMFNYTPAEIVSYVRHGQDPEGIPMRPKFCIDVDCSPQLLELTQICWNEAQHERPDWNFVRSEISRASAKMCTKSGGSLADALMAQMESLTTSLEDVIQKLDFQAYIDQQKKNAMLTLYVPRALADFEKALYSCSSKVYEHVTVVCSDVLNPSVIRAQSSPVQVIDCLEKLSQLSVDILESSGMTLVSHFQDTIIVSSGVPEESLSHAVDGVKYALRLVSALESFTIPYKPDYRFKTRIGISSGTVVGGILNTKIPKFCIYGEVILVSLRMLFSIGDNPGIQISSHTKDLLERSDFVVEHRGLVPYRDGYVTGYWLHGTTDAVLDRFAMNNPLKSAVVKRPSFLYSPGRY